MKYPDLAKAAASGLDPSIAFPACLNVSNSGVMFTPDVTQACIESLAKLASMKPGSLVTMSLRKLAGFANISTKGR